VEELIKAGKVSAAMIFEAVRFITRIHATAEEPINTHTPQGYPWAGEKSGTLNAQNKHCPDQRIMVH
jgi:hypothetical protein